MDNKEFYRSLKEKMSFLANLVAVLAVLIPLIIFLYTKVFNSDVLKVNFHNHLMPLKSFDELAARFRLDQDSIYLDDCNIMTHIILVNKNKKAVKNVEIPLDEFYSDESIIPKGYYITNYDQKLKYFSGRGNIEIPEIKPIEQFDVFIYSTTPGIWQDDIIVTDDGIAKVRELSTIFVENNLDSKVTFLVADSKLLQSLIYIFTIIGFFFFFKIIIPSLIAFLPKKGK